MSGQTYVSARVNLQVHTCMRGAEVNFQSAKINPNQRHKDQAIRLVFLISMNPSGRFSMLPSCEMQV